MAPPQDPSMTPEQQVEQRLRRVEANVSLALAYVREIAQIHLGVVRCAQLERDHEDP